MWRKLIGPLAFVCLFVIQASVQQVRNANFIVDNFHYLNVSQVGSALVSSSIDCGHACLKVVSCFSFNFEAFPDGDGTFWCELLATDKYNASDKLEANQLFHHFSIFTPCSEKPCENGGKCLPLYEHDDYKCKCPPGFEGKKCEIEMPLSSSCSDLKSQNFSLTNGDYIINPDGVGGVGPFTVFCDMSDKAGVGVTVISHDSETRTLVDGCEPAGCYSRDVTCTGASLAQLASLTRVSSHCEQFIKYECYGSTLLKYGDGWLVSRDGTNMLYWGGASPGSNKCACGMNSTCANPSLPCNCDKNDKKWRQDSGLLTHKSDLPVSQLRFGDTGSSNEKGYYTLGKLKCYGSVFESQFL